jgi:hypothetical protein
MRQADWSESTHAETIERRLGRECSMLTWVDTLGLAFYGHCRRRAGSREVETSRETGGSAFKGCPSGHGAALPAIQFPARGNCARMGVRCDLK